MDDRERAVRSLAAELSARNGVTDAWTAKSFTDLLVVVEIPPGKDCQTPSSTDWPTAVWSGPAFAGELDDCRRYRFVDTESRGNHRSYVVE